MRDDSRPVFSITEGGLSALARCRGDLCAIVFYKKRINGQVYPKAARTGPYAYAQKVERINGKVVTRYIGIARVPERHDVIEKGGEDSADRSSQFQEI